MNPFDFWLTIVGPALIMALAALGWFGALRLTDALTALWLRSHQSRRQNANETHDSDGSGDAGKAA